MSFCKGKPAYALSSYAPRIEFQPAVLVLRLGFQILYSKQRFQGKGAYNAPILRWCFSEASAPFILQPRGIQIAFGAANLKSS